MLSILFPCHPDQFLPLCRDTLEFQQTFKMQNFSPAYKMFSPALMNLKSKTPPFMLWVTSKESLHGSNFIF